MTLYTVHEPVMAPGSADPEAADAVRFVKEGFCWPALFIAVPWLVYHRMWLTLILYMAVAFALSALVRWLGVDGAAGALVPLAFALLFALEANELRRRSLARRGWRMTGIVAGESIDVCERRFFGRWLTRSGRPAMASSKPAMGAPLPATSAGHDGIIGSFPEPGGR